MDKVVEALDYSNEEKTTKTLAEYEQLKTDLEKNMKDWENNTVELEGLNTEAI